MTRTKKGWLPAHDLRSGLSEQYARSMRGNLVGVTLSWSRANNDYHVTTIRNGAVIASLHTVNLRAARERFDREVRRVCAPPIKEGASR